MHDVPYFDRFAPIYDRLLPETDPAPIDAGLASVEGPITRVLDLGGGTGRAGRAIAPETLVFDASLPMLAQAEKNGYPTVRGDVRSIPLASETLDAVVSVDAVHHLPDVDAVLNEVRRVLRPGGAFVVRDFDPTTVRGWALTAAEHLVGFDSTFYAAEALGERMAAALLQSRIIETGFVYTVVGMKPESAEQA